MPNAVEKAHAESCKERSRSRVGTRWPLDETSKHGEEQKESIRIMAKHDNYSDKAANQSQIVSPFPRFPAVPYGPIASSSFSKNGFERLMLRQLNAVSSSQMAKSFGGSMQRSSIASTQPGTPRSSVTRSQQNLRLEKGEIVIVKSFGALYGSVPFPSVVSDRVQLNEREQSPNPRFTKSKA